MSKRQSRELSERVGECVRIYRRKLTWQATDQVNGEQVRQSLNTENKKVAIQRAWELDRQLTAGESLSRKKPATLSEVIDAYQEHLIAEQRAEATVSKTNASLKLLAETGFRIGEAMWLTWADVDFKANVLHVRLKDGWKPKSGDARTVPISPRLAQLLHERPRQGRWVLTSPRTRKYPANDRQIAKSTTPAALKQVLSMLGIEGKPHTFRHAFISRCLTKGIEEAVVRSWVGHVDAEIMRLYTHISSKVSQDRIKLLGKPNTEVEHAAKSDAANPA